jgi:S1-C subfamily serine protease
MDLPSAIEHIRPSVFQICVQVTGATFERYVLGTGFLVTEDGLIVTAKHVADVASEMLEGPGSRTLVASFAAPNVDTPTLKMRANFSSVPLTLVSVDADNDLGLLRLGVSPDSIPVMQIVDNPGEAARPRAAAISVDRPVEGELVAVSGYPLNEAALVTNAGSIASSWAVDEDNRNDRYLGDFTANPGNSGAPVYRLSDGAVIGVCQGGKLTPVVGGAGKHAAFLTIIVPSQFVSSLVPSSGR